MTDLDLSNDLDRQIELQDLRTLVLSGKALPPERFRQLLNAIREGRDNAQRLASASKKSAKKTLAAKTPIDLSTLF